MRARSRSLSPSGSRASRSLADSCARSLSSQEELRREALKQRAEHSVHSEDPGWEEEEEGKGAISSGRSLTGPGPFRTPAGRPLSSLPVEVLPRSLIGREVTTSPQSYVIGIWQLPYIYASCRVLRGHAVALCNLPTVKVNGGNRTRLITT